MTKNHKENSTELVSGCMPEVRGSSMCPVSNFEKYLYHLNPKCKALWQKPKTWKQVSQSGDARVWYCNIPIGTNTLCEFMSRMLHSASLSRVYTNHCIRATGCTFLHRTNFSPKQIMSVTGHHSLNSLAIYEKVSTNKKLTMGLCMNYYLCTDNLVNAIQVADKPQIANKKQQAILPKGAPSATVSRPLQPIHQNIVLPPNPITTNVVVETPKEQNLIVPYEEPEDPFTQHEDMLSDFDLMEYVANLQEEEETVLQKTQQSMTISNEIATKSTSVQQKTTKRSPNIPMFSNCKIGSITININKS